MIRRRNTDVGLRRLERLAAAGDPEAQLALEAGRIRRGLPPVPTKTERWRELGTSHGPLGREMFTFYPWEWGYWVGPHGDPARSERCLVLGQLLPGHSHVLLTWVCRTGWPFRYLLPLAQRASELAREEGRPFPATATQRPFAVHTWTYPVAYLTRAREDTARVLAFKEELEPGITAWFQGGDAVDRAFLLHREPDPWLNTERVGRILYGWGLGVLPAPPSEIEWVKRQKLSWFMAHPTRIVPQPWTAANRNDPLEGWELLDYYLAGFAIYLANQPADHFPWDEELLHDEDYMQRFGFHPHLWEEEDEPEEEPLLPPDTEPEYFQPDMGL